MDHDTWVFLTRLEEKIDQVLEALAGLKVMGQVSQQLEAQMAGELDALKTNVEQNANVTQSAVQLLQGLKAKLDEAIASGDPNKIKAFSDQLGTNTQALADAVAANTPATP